MQNLENITGNEDSQNYISGRGDTVQYKRPFLGGFAAKAFLYASALLMFAVGTGSGCSGDGNNPPPPPGPTANLAASPNPGPKPLNGVELDASASTPGTGTIDEYRFDFDDDGTDDYTETSAFAPDGTFDGKTIAPNYPNEGDFPAKVTVRNSSGQEASTTTAVEVGFGTDYTGAMDYMDGVFTGNSWNVYRDDYGDNTDFQLLDPNTGWMVQFTADLEGYDPLTGESRYILWEWANLNAAQQACLNARAAESPPLVTPTVIVTEDFDSPLTLEGMLGF